MSSNTYCPTCDRYIDLSLPQIVRSLTELSNNHPQLQGRQGSGVSNCRDLAVGGA